jgi:hypothetical protein
MVYHMKLSKYVTKRHVIYYDMARHVKSYILFLIFTSNIKYIIFLKKFLHVTIYYTYFQHKFKFFQKN